MPQRSLIKMILLTIITFGIYQIYWVYKTRQELVAEGQKVPPFVWLLLPYLVMAMLALSQFVVHFALNSSDPGGTSSALNVLTIVLGLLAFIALVPIALYWFYKYCQAVDTVTKGDLSFGMSYGSLLISGLLGVSFLWPFFVQYYFNQLSEEPIDVPVPKVQ